jgi:hypothetical protein
MKKPVWKIYVDIIKLGKTLGSFCDPSPPLSKVFLIMYHAGPGMV